ncbi:heparin lyase I family protein, partial [Planktomarina temperata]|nr:heparin lyase I family protein [Planktomarina temperata]
LAIHDMRPDGSFPTDSARSGMGLHYSSIATGHLVMMSALIYSNTQQDLFSYTVDGRSIHDAVNFIVKAIKQPVITNKLYALPCPGGGDRWATIGDPELAFTYTATYLQVYANLFQNSSVSDFIHEHFPSESFRPSRLYATIPRLLVAKENFDRNFEIQQHLLALGYDADPIDGIVTRNLKRQLTRALFENGYAFDGTVDDEELATLKTITKQNNVFVPNRMLGVTRKNLEKIMDNQTARLFQASDMNTNRTDSFEIVEFEGRTAAKFSVSFKDKGHPNDWGRFGTVGHAQRFQVQEKERTHEMVDGKEYWYKFSLFIPEGAGSEHHTVSPFDFKDRRNGSQRDPALAFDIIQNQTTMVLKTHGEECRKVINTQGIVSDFCERPGLFANMIENKLRNRWLDFVFHIDLRKGQERTKFWINKKLTGVFNGDLSPYGKYLGFKFGLYRHHMTEAPGDETLYYSDIMRRHSCEELGIDSCNDFKEAQDQNGVFGAKEIVACFREPSQGKPCPTVCTGRECEQL